MEEFLSEQATSLSDPHLARAAQHPLRLAILKEVCSGDASVEELAERLDAEIAVVSYHCSILETSECLELVGVRPGCSPSRRFYRARPRAFPGHPDWGVLPALLDDRSVTSIKAFVDRLSGALDAGLIDGIGTTSSWVEIEVDDVGLLQIKDLVGAALAQIQLVHDQSKERSRMTGSRLHTLSIANALLEGESKPRGPSS